MIMHNSLFRCNPKNTIFYKTFFFTKNERYRTTHEWPKNQVVPRGKMDSMLCKSTMT